MNNDYKWETVGRCKFYTDGTTCTDIEKISRRILVTSVVS